MATLNLSVNSKINRPLDENAGLVAKEGESSETYNLFMVQCKSDDIEKSVFIVGRQWLFQPYVW